MPVIFAPADFSAWLGLCIAPAELHAR
jgi:hypothetical protein